MEVPERSLGNLEGPTALERKYGNKRTSKELFYIYRSPFEVNLEERSEVAPLGLRSQHGVLWQQDSQVFGSEVGKHPSSFPD